MFSSLKTKLILLVSALLFLAISGVATIIYLDNLERIERGLGEKARAIARTASTGIDGDAHQEIALNISGAAAMPEFQKINKTLRKIKDLNQLQTDVYTYIKTWWVEQDYISFLGSSSEEEFSPNKGQTMQEENRIPLIDGKDGYSGIVTNINGEWITGFSPIKTSDGKVSGVVEVALKTSEEVADAKNAFLKTAGIAAIIAMLVGMFLTYLVSSSITKPIKELIAVTKKMSSGDLEIRSNIKGKDEIASLGTDFNTMAENLQKSYSELEKYSKNLESMVEERTAEVVAGKKKIQKILDNIEQGIITFDQSLKIDSEFSNFMSVFYETDVKDIAGKDVVEFVLPNATLSSDELAQTQQTLNILVGEDSIAWDFNSEHLPSEVEIEIKGQKKIISLDWTPILDQDDKIERLMLAIKDMTIQRQLELEMSRSKAKNEKTMTIVSELIANKRSSIDKYFSDAKSRMKNVMNSIESSFDLDKTFVDLHTIKGGARLLNAKELMNKAHVAEDSIQTLRKESSTELNQDSKDSLIALNSELQAYLGVYNKVLSGGDESKSGESDNILGIVGGQIDVLRQNIEKNGCSFNSLTCIDTVLHWNNNVITDIAGIITHGINNSIDHGYLRPKAGGKQVKPVDLHIESKISDEQITLEIRDLGEGFDFEAIKSLAKNQNKPSETEAELLSFLFEHGSSTAESVSESSGRGVGLAAIKELVENLGGDVQLQSNQPKGASLCISLPKDRIMYTDNAEQRAIS